MHSVLNTLSECTYFYQKTLLHTLLLLVFKIIESLKVVGLLKKEAPTQVFLRNILGQLFSREPLDETVFDI